MTVWLVPPVLDAPRRAEVASVAMTGDGEAVVALKGVDDAATAEALVGCHCLVSRSEIAEAGLSAVLGAAMSAPDERWRFVDTVTGKQGVVLSMEETGGQTLLTVALDGEDGQGHLVPLVDELVVDEDEEARVLTMACPQGLLEL